MALHREQGIVLRSYKLGEADRIVHLLSPARGKVRGVAKGVRRPGSRFGGRLEPFSHVDAQLYVGRSELETITQVELLTSFAEVRDDWVASACGQAMVEAADRVAQPQERSTRLFLLLLDGLRALRSRSAGPAATLDAYLLRLADVAGYGVSLDSCASCGAAGPHSVLHLAAGGALCTRCAPADSQPLPPETWARLRSLAAGPWDALDTAGHDDATRRRAGALVHSYLTYHLGKPLVSWDAVPR